MLVLARVRYDASVARLIALAHAHRVTVLFDCDDLVFDARFVHLVLDTLDQDTHSAANFDGWFAYVGRLEAVARLCDGGITTNDFLAARMTDVIRGPAAVVPNFLNRCQQRTSDVLLAEKAARGYRGDGTVGIGYFSGSPTHNRDFAIAAPAARATARRRPGDSRPHRGLHGLDRTIGRLRRPRGTVSTAGLDQPPEADRRSGDQHRPPTGQRLHQLQERTEVFRGCGRRHMDDRHANDDVPGRHQLSRNRTTCPGR